MSDSREILLPPFRFWETRWGRSGTPVVLIHGLGGSADWWRRNVEELAREHVVAAVDLIGFGRNRLFARPSALPLGFADVAALLARWIEGSFGGRVHLVGNSMGGHIAIYLAALRPDLVRSLTLVDSTGIPFERTPAAHIQNLVIPRGAFSFTHILARDAFRSGPTSLAVAITRVMRDDARPMMRGLAMPALLLWGEHDPLVPLAYGERMAEEIPNARLVVIPRAGHIPMWENAAAFNRELTHFLREVDAVERPVSAEAADAPFAWPIAGWNDGIAWRAAGPRNDIVLLHGLGMSSSYLQPLARALFAHGWNPVAPDLRGFGESANAASMTPREHAEALAGWADAVGVRDSVWVGHSLGCNVMAHLAALRPDLARASFAVGPLWTTRGRAVLRLLVRLPLDAFREPLALYAHVLPAYWRTGAARWWMTFWKSLGDIESPAPAAVHLLAGDRDPIPDASLPLQRVPGAHACLFSNGEGVAAAIDARLQP